MQKPGPSGHPGSQPGQDVGGSHEARQACADVQVPQPGCRAVQHQQYSISGAASAVQSADE
jgi:hypothetical protein